MYQKPNNSNEIIAEAGNVGKSVAYGLGFPRKGEREERKGRKERREQGSGGGVGRQTG